MHDSDDSVSFALADDAATQAFGRRLAQVLQPGMSIWLSGDLGAGKTTLTRGLLRGLGYEGKVKSPTYTLVELYEVSRFNLYHFDLYRLLDPDEWEDAGFRECFNPASVCVLEWPEKARDVLPEADLQVRLDFAEEARIAEVRALTLKGKACVAQLLS